MPILLLRKRKLRHSLGRPSRSDFVQFDFIKDYCEKYIPQIHPNVPDATYLVWLDCRELGMSNEELSHFMVEKAGLGLSDGYTFGRSLSGYMRLNAACPRSVLKQALEQLRAAVEAL